MLSLLSTAEVADQLGVSVDTVLRLARSGELRYAMKMKGLRGAYFFDAGDLALWARQNGRLLKKAS